MFLGLIFAVSFLFSQTLCQAVASGSKVLVLGSGGLVGSALVKWLEKNKFQVVHVKNRRHIDLREPNALEQFTNSQIEFVFFLACEVGGSKFIASSEGSVQQQILVNNIKIYQTVFPWLEKTKIPFLFTSSYLQSSPGSYGSIKRVGEAWIDALGFGKVARLWNIYGYEPIGIKSHVIADWVGSCIQENQLYSRTDGREMRQFLHTDDCASALGTMMQMYDQLDVITDVSSNLWTSMRKTAKIIAAEAPDCRVEFSDIQAIPRLLQSPDITSPLYVKWSPNISLAEGVRRLFEEYKNH